MAALGIASLFTACSPEDASGGNGTTPNELDASFTITPKPGATNRYILHANSSDNTYKHFWDSGLGNGDAAGGEDIEIFLPDVGEYTVRHTSVGYIGGKSYTTEQTINVTTPDPVAGNLILGGKFNSVDDYNQFDILTISASGAAWSYDSANKRATLQGGGWNQQGIFQAVQVEAGKSYRVDMKVTGTGSVNTWFELYISQTPPTQGVEYNAGGKRMQINTWAGCGGSPYDGLFSAVQCAANETSGPVVTFDTTGTAYVVIRGGGENVGSISIDNVEMRRTE